MIMRRIEAEELCIDYAELVVTITSQKIEDQWGMHDGFHLELNKKIKHRAKHGVNCYGHYMPQMAVHAKNHTPIEIKLHFY